MELKLPLNVISQIDVARLLREINALNDFLAAAAVRKAGTPVQPPALSRVLDQVARDNGCNLLDGKQRQVLQQQLDILLAKAPVLHISFAAEPSPAALERVLSWLRQNIQPQTLLQVGLQPGIAAGCMVRTPNRVFDMSLRAYLRQQEPYLVELIAGAARG